MKRYYSYAGIHLSIEMEDNLYDGFHLQQYEIAPTDNTYHYHFHIVDKLSEPVGKLTMKQPSFIEYHDNYDIIKYMGVFKDDYHDIYMRVYQHHYDFDIEILSDMIKDKIGDYVIYRVIESEKLINEVDGVLMHASFIEYKGKAIVFTAPSGTGKSTQANLWVKNRGAEIINGDRCALRFIDGKVYACGVPFAGSSNISKNKTLELSCIVCLGQAPHTSISPLQGYKAFRYLWPGIAVNTWDKEHVEVVSNIVERIIKNVPIYKLDCTPDISAVEAMEECLK